MSKSNDTEARARLRIEVAEWARLAQSDPVQFEQRRRDTIEAVIAQAPEALQPRLRGLQFRIDMERMRAKTALGAAIRLHSMMWDEFQALRDALNHLGQIELRTQSGIERARAEVIPLPSRD